MNIKSLESFITIVQEGSFSKAAKVLYVSQSALSQQIQSLEKEIGFSLFIRNKSKANILSKSGEEFFNYVQNALSILDSGIKKCKTLDLSTYSQLSICCDIYDVDLLPQEFYAELSKKLSNIQISLLLDPTGDIAHLLNNKEADMYFVGDCFSMISKSMYFQPVITTNYMFAMSKNHPLANKDKIKLDDLKGQHVSFARKHLSDSYDHLVSNIIKTVPTLVVEKNYSHITKVSAISSQIMFLTVDSAKSHLDELACVPLDTKNNIQLGFVYNDESSALIPIVEELIEKIFLTDK